MGSILDCFSSLTEEEKIYKNNYVASNELCILDSKTPKMRPMLASKSYNLSNESPVKVLKHPVFMPKYLHCHEFAELTWIYKGKAEENIEGESFTLERGQILFIAPGTYHTIGVFDQDTIALNILIGKELFFSLLPGYERILSSKYGVFASDETESIIESLVKEGETKDFATRKIEEALLRLLFARLERNKCILTSSKEKATLYCYLDYIKANYRTVTLSSFASKFGISEQYASSLLKKKFKEGFTSIVRRQKMDEACKLLSSTSLSCKEISWQIGYSSAEHFSRTFSKYYGVTPEQWRQSR